MKKILIIAGMVGALISLSASAKGVTTVAAVNCPAYIDVCIEFKNTSIIGVTSDPVMRQAVTNAIQQKLMSKATLTAVSYKPDSILYEFNWVKNK